MAKTEDAIDFYKYLNCPDCKNAGLYCTPHKIEVEKILNQNQDSIQNVLQKIRGLMKSIHLT